MFKSREAREPVILSVRIRLDTGWVDATIRNISSKGMKLEMANPPPRGSFIEIRRGSAVVVGQVRWVAEGCCGLLAQGRVPVSQFKAPPSSAPQSNADGLVTVERRATARVMSAEEVAERSRLKAMLMQKVIIAAAGIAGACFIGSLMLGVVGKPMETIEKHL